MNPPRRMVLSLPLTAMLSRGEPDQTPGPVSGIESGADLLAAVSRLGPQGGALTIGRGRLVLRSGLAIAAPTSLAGPGGSYAALVFEGLSQRVNNLTISPSRAFNHEGQTLSGFALHEPRTGTRAGLHGVFLDTRAAGQFLPKLTIRDVIVGQSVVATGRAVYHLHDPANGVQGGLYGAVIENCTLKGGIKLENSGDSISIVRNILTGSNIGVEAALISGASLLEIAANNITNAGGAVRLTSGSRPRVVGNNIENNARGAAAQNDGAIIALTGTEAAIHGGVIRENLISGFGASDARVLLRLNNCHGTAVRDNVFLSGSPSLTVAIEIGPDCRDVRIEANTFNGAITMPVVDRGVGTMGVLKSAALGTGWTASGPDQPALQFLKDTGGVVRLFGMVVRRGTRRDGSITTLPPGFRPEQASNHLCPAQQNGGSASAQVRVEPDGEVRVVGDASMDRIELNLFFPAERLAHALSLE